MKDQRCPCGGPSYATCCGPYISGEKPPPTAEALMRSRFSAYSRGEYGWLALTHLGLGPADVPELTRQNRGVRWSRLEIKATDAGGPDDDEGVVEFVAHGRRTGRPHVLHEVSRFARIDGRWTYVDGELKAHGRPRRRLR